MASRADDLLKLLTGEMGHGVARARAFVGSLDDAAIARLMAQAENGDPGPLLKAFANQTWATAPTRVVSLPVEPSPAAGRDPVSFRDRISSDPKIRAGLEDAGISPAGLSDAEALKAYVRNVRGAAPPRGRPRSAEDAIRELAKPADQVAAENIAGQFERATTRPFADDAARQAELPFGPEEVRSPEVVINGPAARAADEARLQEYMDGPAARPRPASTLADDMTFDEVPARPRKPRVEPNDDAYRRAAYAAGAAGAAGGAYLLSRGGGEEPALTGSGNPAELQDEDPISGSALAFSDEVGMGRPASDLTRSIGQPAQADHSVEYLKRMRELNRMNRTGAPTPEERAMQAEVRRLADLATQQRREAGYSFPANHPTARLRNEAMRFPIGSPERDRLNAQADAVENAVVTGRTPWDFGSTPEDPWAELNGPVAEPARPEHPVVPRPAQRAVAPKPAARPPADLAETGNPAELVPIPTSPAQAKVDAVVEDAINPPPPPPRRPAPSPAQEGPMPPKPVTRAPSGPTTDFSQTPDDVLEQIFQLIQTSDGFVPNPQERQAVIGEYYRRRFNREHPSQQADNDAAATPITPDATVKDKPAPKSPRDIYHARLVAAGYTPEQANQIIAFESTQAGGIRPQDVADEALARKAAQSNAAHNRWDAQAGPRVTRDDLRRQADAEVRANGSPANYADTGLHTDYRSPYGPMTNFAEGAMATVDGVQVPGFDLGDGRLRYRLGDVKAAQEAERDARWLAGHRAMVDEENAKYGHYSIPDTSDKLTPAQEEARDARRRAESAEQNSTRAKELRRQRLHARAGIPEQATDNMSENERLRMMGRNADSARERSSREAVIRRAQAQQNPLEYLGRSDINDWQQMVMADRLLRAGAGQMTPLGVEAVGGQNALNMLRGMNLGQGMDNPLVRAQANAANVQTEAAQRAMRAEDEQVLGEKYAPTGYFGYDEFTIEEQQQMLDDLMARGYSLPEAQAAVDRQTTQRRATNKMTWTK